MPERARVGFITEVDVVEPPSRPRSRSISRGGGSSASAPSLFEVGRSTDVGVITLPRIISLRVEDAELPVEATADTENFAAAPLPGTLPLDKVEDSIAATLEFRARPARLDHAKQSWLKDFRSKYARAFTSDAFWYCVCCYFLPGKHPDVERRLFDRIAVNFVRLFDVVPHQRKDSFFRYFADAVSQAILYSMLLAYPKSRSSFGERFRQDLVCRISHWTTGVRPEMVDTSHWKLNLGGGDVLQPAQTPAWHRPREDGGPSTAMGTRPGAMTPASGRPGAMTPGATSSSQAFPRSFSSEAALGERSSRYSRRDAKTSYSPLVAHFLKARKKNKDTNSKQPLDIKISIVQHSFNVASPGLEKFASGTVSLPILPSLPVAHA